MPFDIGSAAFGVGTNLLSTGLGLALENHEDKRQINQQQKLQDMSIAGQKQMADYNQANQMRMWNATNYEAQIAHMKNAGLNPALLYGTGGGGGTTVGSANDGNVTEAHGPVGGGEIQAVNQMAIQSQLMAAQTENIKADTKLKETEATKTAGADTAVATAQAASLTQGIQNAKAQEALTNVQTAINNVQLTFDKDTLNLRESTVNLTLSKINEEINLLSKQNLVEAGTIQTKISLAHQELVNKVLEAALTQAQTSATNQSVVESIRRVQNMVQQNMREWDQLSNQNQQLRINQMQQEWQQSGMPEGVKQLLDHIVIIPGFKK